MTLLGVLQPIAVAMLTSGGTVLVGWLVLRGNKINAKVTTSTDLINQLQDERDRAHETFRQELADQRGQHQAQMAEIKAEHERQRADLEAIVDAARSDRRVLTDYVEALRRQISEEKPPPPLPWPDGLRA